MSLDSTTYSTKRQDGEMGKWGNGEFNILSAQSMGHKAEATVGTGTARVQTEAMMATARVHLKHLIAFL